MIKIEIEAAKAVNTLERLAESAFRMNPIMGEIAGIMHDAVEQNFLEEGRPKWLGLKPASWLSRAGPLTKRGKVSRARFDRNVRNAKILQQSGRLASSILMQWDSTSAVVGTNVKYAAIHQFGGRTSPHEIRPRYKKALAWATGGHPVKSVQHPGSEIPARPFLKLTPDDEGRIASKVSDYLRSILG